ncbi:retropepsin-like aspartic protease [Chryseolinea lacunae]|uniref:Clan AA aspartic protease n=1 Tax=Chryseolinea lacunae TaxID=2801331 RepID=A0ABS1KUJ5_9BACT|nr:retropepsin-like aspartic protease [Chryseolinea lacunae]MBL0743144.1 clan AA aspartic protease [Chryseolinea lacunae]
MPQRVRFQPYGRIPVIEAKLNGKPAFFIVDTGASVSILNEQAARHFGFRIATEGMYEAVEVTGFNGTSTMHHAGRCILEIGDLQIRSLRFKSRDMSDFSSVFFDQERIRIAGILGADMLTQYNMTIDFGTKTLVFKATPISK